MDLQTFGELGFELWKDRGSVDQETELKPRSRVFTVLSPTNQPMGYALALETGEIVDRNFYALADTSGRTGFFLLPG